jgi:hypothetical protein
MHVAGQSREKKDFAPRQSRNSRSARKLARQAGKASLMRALFARRQVACTIFKGIETGREDREFTQSLRAREGEGMTNDEIPNDEGMTKLE